MYIFTTLSIRHIPITVIMAFHMSVMLVNMIACVHSVLDDVHTCIYTCIHVPLPCRCTECGGKMHLREGEFSRAHTDFFEAFKNYDESGSPR